MKKEAYVGLDVHKDSVAVAVAAAEKDGEVRFHGNIPNTEHALVALFKKLSETLKIVEVAYEAGPTGYKVHRLLTERGFACRMVAPSLIPKTTRDRIKNDHRDAMTLARLLRAGELAAIWVPDEIHESVRDLVRSHHAAARDLRTAKARIQSFLLRHQRSYPGKAWTGRHRIWLANLQFATKAQQITLQNYVIAMEQALARRDQIEGQMREIAPEWALYPLVVNLQALRGVAFLIAMTVVSEIGDFSRFGHPAHLMAFLGLVPGEHSSGARTRGTGITRTGNTHVRTLLYEAAWHYRSRPKVGSWMLQRMPADIPQAIRDVAWKAQLRLHKRYGALCRAGKKTQVAVTAVARELVGFIWSIGTATPLPAS
jgi:transposase